jgi:hypothetical protein
MTGVLGSVHLVLTSSACANLEGILTIVRILWQCVS